MLKRIICVLSLVVVLNGGVSPALAYVPSTEQILNQYLKTAGYAKSLDVRQKRVYFDSRIEDGTAEFDEAVKYIFPDRFRSDIVAQTTTKTTISTFDQSLVILDGTLASEKEERYNVYKDILLFRNRLMLTARLQDLGINTENTWMTRFEDRIVFVIGDRSEWGIKMSTLFIDKKTFLPVRLFLNRPDDEQDSIEVLFLEWKTYGKTKYPSRIEFFKNLTMVRELRIEGIICDVAFDEALFDVAAIKAELEKQEKPATAPEGAEPENELKKTIEGLDKIIEKDPMAF